MLADEDVPIAGLVSNAVLAAAGATHARVYARVACDPLQAE